MSSHKVDHARWFLYITLLNPHKYLKYMVLTSQMVILMVTDAPCYVPEQ